MLQQLHRSFGTSSTEIAMEERLKSELNASKVEVTDVSGGCGSFYKVKVVSKVFEGKSPVERNRLVHAVLKKELGDMHGLNVECLTK